MARLRPEEANDSQIASDIVYWEDPDSLLLFGVDEDGSIFVADREWNLIAYGRTAREALIKFGYRVFESDPSVNDNTFLDWSNEPT